jgi:hypothetical protein
MTSPEVVHLLLECDRCGRDTRYDGCPSQGVCTRCDEDHPDFDGEAHVMHPARCPRCTYLPEGLVLEFPAGTEQESAAWAAAHRERTGHEAALKQVTSTTTALGTGLSRTVAIEPVV